LTLDSDTLLSRFNQTEGIAYFQITLDTLGKLMQDSGFGKLHQFSDIWLLRGTIGHTTY